MWTWAEEVPCAWEERRPRSGFRDEDESEEEDAVCIRTRTRIRIRCGPLSLCHADRRWTLFPCFALGGWCFVDGG